jgi:rhodanese-related sulfurtransferase
VSQLERATVPDLRRELAGENAPLVLDLRRDAEVEGGIIPGARHIPLHLLRDRAGELPREGRVVAYCGSGYRSSIGASILHRLGWGNVEDLVGGYNAWKATEPPAAG